MASPEELVGRIVNSRAKILRYAWAVQMFTGRLLLGVGYLIGHAHFYLLRQGVRAPGKIIGYEQKRLGSSFSAGNTSYMPIVEFHASDRFVKFNDWLGSNVAGTSNFPVIVLYDPVNPANAMIDRPVWNWIPWAPTLAVGLLLLLASINGFFRSRRLAEISQD